MIKTSKTRKTTLIILTLFALFIAFNACKKDFIDWAKLQQDEINAREQYLLDSFVTVKLTEDGNTVTGLIIDNDTIKPTSTGLYFIQSEEDKGTGPAPTPGRIVMTKYEGRLLNDTVFDSSDKFSFVYGTGTVMAGWDEALGKMKKGGKVKLIVPSSLAYGQQASAKIPSYSTLIFDIELLNVQK